MPTFRTLLRKPEAEPTMKKSKSADSNPITLTTDDIPLLKKTDLHRKSMWPAPIGAHHYMFIYAVLHLGPAAWEARIRAWFVAQLGKPINPGHISTAGKVLVEQGLVSMERIDPPEGQGGKKVKFYQITPKGRRVMRSLIVLREQVSAGADKDALSERNASRHDWGKADAGPNASPQVSDATSHTSTKKKSRRPPALETSDMS